LEFKSYKAEILKALEEAKKEICTEWGTLIVTEAQLRTPVLTGALKRSETSEIIGDNEGVNVGVVGIPYGLAVEKGDSHHTAQPYLEPAAMDNIPKLQSIANEKIKAHMGGK